MDLLSVDGTAAVSICGKEGSLQGGKELVHCCIFIEVCCVTSTGGPPMQSDKHFACIPAQQPAWARRWEGTDRSGAISVKHTYQFAGHIHAQRHSVESDCTDHHDQHQARDLGTRNNVDGSLHVRVRTVGDLVGTDGARAVPVDRAEPGLDFIHLLLLDLVEVGSVLHSSWLVGWLVGCVCLRILDHFLPNCS